MQHEFILASIPLSIHTP